MSIEVSLVILTWNRWDSVNTSLSANISSAGYPIKEIIHVDNGSKGDLLAQFRREFNPSVQVRHKTNQGVAKGYNRGLALASGSHVVITGCDRIMQPGWLKTWAECFEDYPTTGVISCYSNHEQANHEVSRYRGSQPVKDHGARHTIRGALPVEARIHSKEFLFRAGYFREDFGLYGFEDAEWADRADVTAAKFGLKNYVVDGMFSHHIRCTDFTGLVDGKTYQDFKRETQYGDPRLAKLYHDCKDLGSPNYNPYARVEPNLL